MSTVTRRVTFFNVSALRKYDSPDTGALHAAHWQMAAITMGFEVVTNVIAFPDSEYERARLAAGQSSVSGVESGMRIAVLAIDKASGIYSNRYDDWFSIDVIWNEYQFFLINGFTVSPSNWIINIYSLF
jgi:hypothetical protein